MSTHYENSLKTYKRDCVVELCLGLVKKFEVVGGGSGGWWWWWVVVVALRPIIVLSLAKAEQYTFQI